MAELPKITVEENQTIISAQTPVTPTVPLNTIPKSDKESILKNSPKEEKNISANPSSVSNPSSSLIMPNSTSSVFLSPTKKFSQKTSSSTESLANPSPSNQLNVRAASQNNLLTAEASPTSLSTGSATGNPRNKCALQPGHSLMDWIRLGNSGKDLTGVGGRLRPVSPKELASHKSPGDAWLAIRGRVYNISHYLPYHPGGLDELMRGAGIDATQLFDKVHPWVNYESLLAKCLIGPLRTDRPDAEEVFGFSTPKSSDRLQPSKTQELVRKSMENLANCITPVRKRISKSTDEGNKTTSRIVQSLVHSSELPVSIGRAVASMADGLDSAPNPLRFDWMQTSEKVILSVYTRALSNPAACARLLDGVLVLEVETGGWLRELRLKPENQLKPPLRLRAFAESGKVEVTALKAQPGNWSSAGAAQSSGATRNTGEPRSVRCELRARSVLTHDSVVLALAPCHHAIVVPIGHHIRIHCYLNGTECVRSYTPIGDGWSTKETTETPCIRLAVKRYDTGALTPHLTSLNTGDEAILTGPYGNFELLRLKLVTTVFMLAAGTGITPMLSLINFLLARGNPKCELVHLMFFNKTEEDLMFREKFDELAKRDERFKITHVLSNPGVSWPGPTGRVRSELISEYFTKKTLVCSENCTHYACACGPTEFTQIALDLMKEAGMKEECTHAFLG